MISIEEMLDCIITKIGVMDIGKARWFCKDPSREEFYDKKIDKYIDRNRLLDFSFEILDTRDWITIDNPPEKDGMYLIAWLPNGAERSECFVELAEYNVAYDDWDVEKLYNRCPERRVAIYAWTNLPPSYEVK